MVMEAKEWTLLSVDEWYKRLGKKFQTFTFTCDSVASRLCDDALVDRLDEWYVGLEKRAHASKHFAWALFSTIPPFTFMTTTQI